MQVVVLMDGKAINDFTMSNGVLKTKCAPTSRIHSLRAVLRQSLERCSVHSFVCTRCAMAHCQQLLAAVLCELR